MNWISILSTLVTFGFMAAVFTRYQRKGGAYLLAWSFGLLLYGLGTLTEVVLSLTFSSFFLKLWYLTGAMLTAAWLGQGTVFLLVRKHNLARNMAISLGVVSILAAALVFLAPVTSAAASYNIHSPVSSQYKDILVRNGGIITLTILLNIYGTLALVGGAIYSGYLFWRKRVLLNRVLGNLLIAAGALAPAMAGSFVKAGLVDGLYISEFVGAVIMFLGFLQATAPLPEARQQVPANQGVSK